MYHVRCQTCDSGIFQIYYGGIKSKLDNFYYCKTCKKIVELAVKITVKTL